MHVLTRTRDLLYRYQTLCYHITSKRLTNGRQTPQHEISIQKLVLSLVAWHNTNHQMHFTARRLRPPKDMIKLHKFWKGITIHCDRLEKLSSVLSMCLCNFSSDIVILDDNFSSVVTVLRWGRCVYNHIQKFIQFQLTVNVAALAINFVAAISSGKVPLTAVQLLWVHLIMDTLGAPALATEQPTSDLMEKRPVGRSEPLISKIMWRNLLAQALYQVAILLTLQFKGKAMFGVDEKTNNTLIFNTFFLCQVFNEFNARKLEKKNIFKGIHENKLFLAIIGITIILQVIMVGLLKKFAGTERLNWEQWGACFGIAVLSWPIGCLVKCIPVSSKQLNYGS